MSCRRADLVRDLQLRPAPALALAGPPFMVLHEVAGRCRLRVARLRHDRVLRDSLAHRLSRSPLVDSFRFNLACDSLIVEYQGSIEILFALLLEPIPATLALTTRAAPAVADASGGTKPLQALAWAGAALLLGPSAGMGFATLALLVSGYPIWRRALQTLLGERRLNVDFLDGLALGITVLRQEPRTGALIALLVHLGDWVRERTARQSDGHLRALFDFQTVQARRVESDGSITLVTAQSLQAGQMALLLAGDLVPADGMVSTGLAALDQRHITGESMPANRRANDMVFAGSSVVEGSITIRITEAGADTAVSRIVGMIESTPVGETRIQNYAEQFADRLVAPVLGVNVALLAATANLDRFMSLAIVDYGTGIRIAAPTSVLASMTRAARHGILIKSGRHVENLATLRGIAFDKTGTLTSGCLSVLAVRTFCAGLTADRVLQLAAAAETQLRHPVARALVLHACTVRGLELPICQSVDCVIGLGVAAEVAGYRVHIGSERYLRQLGIATGKARRYLADMERQGHIALLVALDDSLVGAIACSDEPRPEAHAVIAGLRRRGVREIVMISGDREGVARHIAKSVGIDKVYAEVLPQDKAEIVRRLRAANGPFAMVGDGVNDSPALAQADVGIALADSADIARAAADVVLMEEGLHLLLPAIDISRDALALVRQNYGLIAGANTLALALALPSGWISPVACTLLSNGSALLATANAMRPLLAKRQEIRVTLESQTAPRYLN
jgi:manganese/zinc-transporting P-type ATPase C